MACPDPAWAHVHPHTPHTCTLPRNTYHRHTVHKHTYQAYYPGRHTHTLTPRAHTGPCAHTRSRIGHAPACLCAPAHTPAYRFCNIPAPKANAGMLPGPNPFPAHGLNAIFLLPTATPAPTPEVGPLFPLLPPPQACFPFLRGFKFPSVILGH